MAASPAQRAKTAGRPCLVCAGTPADPAHLVARSLGGCDDALCVVPLCRTCHRAFDRHELDLLAALEPEWRPELAHAVEHLGLVGVLRRICPSSWPTLIGPLRRYAPIRLPRPPSGRASRGTGGGARLGGERGESPARRG